MTDVLFGQSYYLRFDPKLWEAMQPYPPLGTLYAASATRERGYTVALFDAMLAESEEEWGRALGQHAPRFAVIFDDHFNYLSKMCLLRMREAAIRMIGMARAHGSTVIVCGADASDHPEPYLDAGAHFVLYGEGDATLLELLDRLSGRSNGLLEAIQGLAFYPDKVTRDTRHETRETRPGDQETAHSKTSETAEPRAISFSPGLASPGLAFPPLKTPRRPDLKDLDALPFPAWDLVDVGRYRAIWRERHGYFSMNMVTTRGCPYHCNWCAKPTWGQRYNSRSPESVAAELRWLKETYAPDHIWFADDIMGLRPGWWRRFADEVERLGAHVPFKCLSRADLLLRDGAIPAMARAGCQIVWIGAESGSQQVLNAMEKGTTVEQIEQAARDLRASGVRVGFFLQFGYPGETREDIERTLDMVRRSRPDDIGMSVSYPLPGTTFYQRVQGELGAKRNWQDSDDLAMLYRGPYTTNFYRQLYVVLHREFRARRYARELLGLLRHPLAARPRHARQAARMAYYALSLPLERRKLAALEREPHAAMPSLAPALDLHEAATPSPQGDA
jgi:anaerobic magnesium-protoporphyrin IX monomethyl ester cyclase